jgi:hypothetical protein
MIISPKLGLGGVTHGLLHRIHGYGCHLSWSIF